MTAMSTRDELLREIDAFLKETGMAPTIFGRDAVKDRALMISLRKGRSPTLDTVDKIRAFMAKERKKLAKRPKAAQERAQAA